MLAGISLARGARRLGRLCWIPRVTAGSAGGRWGGILWQQCSALLYP